MPFYSCACFNISLSVPGADDEQDVGAESSAASSSTASALQFSSVQILHAALTARPCDDTGAVLLRCSVCSTSFLRQPGGLNDPSIDVLVSPTQPPSADQLSSIFRLSLPISTEPSSAHPFSSPPSATPLEPAPATASLLPALPEPFFLPPPFSPSHPLFSSLTVVTSARLAQERDRLIGDIDAFVESKRAELHQLQVDARLEVRDVWTRIQPSEKIPNGEGADVAMERRMSASRERQASGSKSPSTSQGFPTDNVASSSVRATRPPTSVRTQGLADSDGSAFGRSVASPSLLSASIAHNSYMPSLALNTSSSKPLSSTSTASPPLSPLPSRIPHSRQSSSSSRPAATHRDLDLASSMIASTWKEPANLIFANRPVPSKPAEIAAVPRTESYVDSMRRPAEPALTPEETTPPAAEGEEEKVLASSEGPKEGVAGAGDEERSEVEGEGDAKEARGPRRKVTFSEPSLALEDGKEEEEEEVETEHEDIFDFEPHDSDPTSPDRSSSPSGPAASAPSSTSENHTSVPATNSTLPGGSNTSASTSASKDGTSSIDRQGGRTVSAMSGEDDGQNKLLTSMRTLTAADLPSHRAAWKDKNKTWQIYGRLGRIGGMEAAKGDDDDDATKNYKYGQSLPIDIFPGGAASSAPSSTPSSTTDLDPLELKTSLSDRKLFVPPLRKAMRSQLASRDPSLSSSPVVQSPSTHRDPGPMLDEGDAEDEVGAVGFVAPHLRGRGGLDDDGVGWASMVDRPRR